MIPGGYGRVVVQISRQRRNTNHSTGAIAPKASLNDDTRLMEILQAAARALPEGNKERTRINAQLGKMAGAFD